MRLRNRPCKHPYRYRRTTLGTIDAQQCETVIETAPWFAPSRAVPYRFHPGVQINECTKCGATWNTSARVVMGNA